MTRARGGYRARMGKRALAWTGGVLATLLLVVVGAYLLLCEAQGRIAVEFIEAVERGDGEAVAELTDNPSAAKATVWPDHPWTDARIVEVSPDDSHHDYDVTVEVASADLTRSGGTRLTFAVGTVDGREVILDPFTRASITAADGGELTAVTIGGRDFGSGPVVGVSLPPGIYQVTATGSDGAALTGTLTVLAGEDAALALRA